MTEINFVETKNKSTLRRITKTKRKGLRIDMTPMVDLGFLLITFFIVSTALATPAVMNLNMPHDGEPIKIPESKSLTILLSGANKIFFYHGIEFSTDNKKIHQTSYDELSGLGKVIRQKQMELENKHLDKKELVVLIKPGNQSSYRDLVAVLDEMLINNVARYAVVDQEMGETAYLQQYK